MDDSEKFSETFLPEEKKQNKTKQKKLKKKEKKRKKKAKRKKEKYFYKLHKQERYYRGRLPTQKKRLLRLSNERFRKIS